MSSRHSSGKESVFKHDAGQALFTSPTVALGLWNPFMAVVLKGNAEAHEGFVTILTEWHRFVAQRLSEDAALLHRLAQCRTVNQVLSAQTDFWHKASEDYGREISTIAKLMTSTTGKMATTTQTAVESGRDALTTKLAA
jgi:phasin protein